MVLQDGAIVVQGRESTIARVVVQEGMATTMAVQSKEVVVVVRGRAIPTIHRAGAGLGAAAVLDVHNPGPDPADSAVRGNLKVVAEEVCCRNRQVEDYKAGMVEQVSRRTEDMADILAENSGRTWWYDT